MFSFRSLSRGVVWAAAQLLLLGFSTGNRPRVTPHRPPPQGQNQHQRGGLSLAGSPIPQSGRDPTEPRLGPGQVPGARAEGPGPSQVTGVLWMSHLGMPGWEPGDRWARTETPARTPERGHLLAAELECSLLLCVPRGRDPFVLGWEEGSSLFGCRFLDPEPDGCPPGPCHLSQSRSRWGWGGPESSSPGSGHTEELRPDPGQGPPRSPPHWLSSHQHPYLGWAPWGGSAGLEEKVTTFMGCLEAALGGLLCAPLSLSLPLSPHPCLSMPSQGPR